MHGQPHIRNKIPLLSPITAFSDAYKINHISKTKEDLRYFYNYESAEMSGERVLPITTAVPNLAL